MKEESTWREHRFPSINMCCGYDASNEHRLSVAVVATGGGEHGEDGVLEDEFELLLSFFFSPSQALSCILLRPTFVEFIFTGMIHLQRKPRTKQITN